MKKTHGKKLQRDLEEVESERVREEHKPAAPPAYFPAGLYLAVRRHFTLDLSL